MRRTRATVMTGAALALLIALPAAAQESTTTTTAPDELTVTTPFPGVAVEPGLATLPIGKAELRARGSRIALLGFGAIVPAAEKVAAQLGPGRLRRGVARLGDAFRRHAARAHEEKPRGNAQHGTRDESDCKNGQKRSC